MLTVPDLVMSDSEDSTVTYTEAPPSPDYVPGPEEPKQAPPLPKFVPEMVYPEFMPPEDDVLLTEEQLLPVAVLPTADSPGYITEYDPEEDDEDPEEDPADYPDDRDDEEKEEPSGDDSDDEDEDEEEEKQQLAPADSVPPLACQVDRFLAISTLPPSPLTSYSSPLPQIPSPPLPISSPLPVSPPPLPASHTYPLEYRAAMIRLRVESPSTSYPLPLPSPIVLPHTRASVAMMRAAAPSTYILASRSETPPSRTPPSRTPPLLLIPLPTPSSPLLLPSTDCRAGVSEVGESSSAPTARPTREFRRDYGFVATLDDEIRRDPERDDDRSLMSDQLNILRRDRRTHAHTSRLMESEARLSREAWVQSMDASDTTHSEVSALRTTVLAQQTEIGDLRAADRRRQTQLTEALTLLRTLQTQMAVLQRHQTPARDPAHPEVPEEAGSSS
ncbi:hypothetical protein Tco_1116094 [Tanacetum coccineum]